MKLADECEVGRWDPTIECNTERLKSTILSLEKNVAYQNSDVLNRNGTTNA